MRKPITSRYVIAIALTGRLLVPLAEAFEPSPAVVVPIDGDGVQRMTIAVDSYTYEPNHLQIEVGKPVELILRSATIITPHNFVVKEPTAGLMVDEDIPAGKEAVIRFTALKPGVFPFYCDKKLLFFKSHRDKGMEGLLDVR